MLSIIRSVHFIFVRQTESTKQFIRFQTFLAGKLQRKDRHEPIGHSHLYIFLPIRHNRSGRQLMRFTNFFAFENLHDHHFSFRTDQFTPGSRIRRESANKIIDFLHRLIPVDPASLFEYLRSRTNSPTIAISSCGTGFTHRSEWRPPSQRPAFRPTSSVYHAQSLHYPYRQ